MAATPGEQILLAALTKLSGGQAPGSFGPAQALALLAGFLKLRDRVDQLVLDNADLAASIATFGGIDAAPRLAALEELTAELQNVVAGDTDRVGQLETWKTGVDGRLDDLEARVATLENPPPAP